MEASLPQETTARSNSERITAIEATLPHLATKADLERHTRLLIMWFVGTQIALFAALFALLSHFLG
ncbi:MAG: hypothetical protein OXE52_15080 [Chloroflexi bacterium]|nr:hypothetical protein [Chloroflexota bacterium]